VARRWLAVGDDPVTLTVAARCAADGVHVTVDDGEAAEPAVEVTVLLGRDHPAPGPAGPPTAGPGGVGPLYGGAMFHGPRWRGVRSVTARSPSGLSASLTTLGLAGHPPLALDPVALDAAGQLVGFWGMDHLGDGEVMFPFLCDRLDVHGPAPGAGARLTGHASVSLVGDDQVRADLSVTDGQGRPWLTLTGWRDRRFTVPAPLRPLLAGGRGPLSQDCPGPAAALGPPGAFACRRIDARLPADGAPWAGIWAQRVLNRTERAALADRDAPVARRHERLGARTAAKEAVATLLGLAADVDPAAIEILDDERGRPAVSGCSVSWAHSGGTAVAVAGPSGRLGIDVEPLRPLATGFADTAFAPAELDLLPGDDEWTLRCWCAKEAVAKALGTGLTLGPRALRITAVDPGTGRVLVALVRAPGPDTADLVGIPLITHTLIEEDLIVATTTCAPAEHEQAGTP
jgi:phosphopantetheinyl transferase